MTRISQLTCNTTACCCPAVQYALLRLVYLRFSAPRPAGEAIRTQRVAAAAAAVKHVALQQRPSGQRDTKDSSLLPPTYPSRPQALCL